MKSLIEKAHKIFEAAKKQNPYKVKGNPESFSRYAEGWQDAIYEVETDIIKTIELSFENGFNDGFEQGFDEGVLRNSQSTYKNQL